MLECNDALSLVGRVVGFPHVFECIGLHEPL